MNIRVDLNTSIKDGLEVVFRSPVDCSQVTGLIVYYNDDSKEFAFADAHGNNVGDIDHLFAENVVVKVILDVTNGMAFVQNADTNTYLEEQFAKCVKTVNGTAPDENGNVELDIPSGGGSDGITPHIGDNGNWWIGEEDTGVSAGVTDEQISGAVEEYMEENPLVKTVNGVSPDENGNVKLDIPSGGVGGGSPEGGAFYFTVILEEDVSSVSWQMPVNWERMIQFNIHATTTTDLTADMEWEINAGGSYKRLGALSPGLKGLNFYGIRFMLDSSYNTVFVLGTSTAYNSSDMALPTIPTAGNVKTRPNTNHFQIISKTDGVMFPTGTRFDVWGVYA